MSKLRIKEVIKEKGSSLEALSKKIGVNASAISQSINGNPTVERLNQIADALGVDVTELFARKQGDSSTCPKCGAILKISIQCVSEGKE